MAASSPVRPTGGVARHDLASLFPGDETVERVGASKALPLVGLGEEDRADLRPGAFEDRAPLLACLAELASFRPVVLEMLDGGPQQRGILVDPLGWTMSWHPSRVLASRCGWP